jgi:hypothetical protein
MATKDDVFFSRRLIFKLFFSAFLLVGFAKDKDVAIRSMRFSKYFSLIVVQGNESESWDV